MLLIGADSKPGGGWAPGHPVCKIRPCGQMFLALRGSYQLGIENPGPKRFEPFRDTADACHRSNDAVGKITEIERAIAGATVRVFEDGVVYGYPDEWERLTMQGIAGVVLVTIENGTPTVMARSFAFDEGTVMSMMLKEQCSASIAPAVFDRLNCPPQCPTMLDADEFTPFRFGYHDAIDARLADPSLVIPDDWGSFMKSLIESQADATPNAVGRPVDVLRVTASGAQWLEPTGRCAQEEEEKAHPMAPTPVPFPGVEPR